MLLPLFDTRSGFNGFHRSLIHRFFWSSLLFFEEAAIRADRPSGYAGLISTLYQEPSLRRHSAW